MLLGVAVILAALTVSATTAIIFDMVYQALSNRRWPAEMPPMAVAVSVLAVVVGATIGSALG